MNKNLKGKYRFYLEYPTEKDKKKGTRKEPGNHSGNCIALLHDDKGGLMWVFTNKGGEATCLGAVFHYPNSDVCVTSVRFQYLYERCKSISRKLAEEIHPKLFEYIRLAEQELEDGSKTSDDEISGQETE